MADPALLERLASIVAAQEPERLYDFILSSLGEALDAQSGALWIVTGKGDAKEVDLAIAATRGLPPAGRQQGNLRADGAFAQRLEAGKPFAWPETPDPRAALRVPLCYKGRVFGLVELADRLDGRAFDEKDRETASIYSPFCAIAVGNALKAIEVKRRALKDPETETYNLLYFVDYAGKEIYKARRYSRKFSLLVIKLDNLPVIKAGVPIEKAKEIVKAFIDCLRNALRDADTLAKVADDELWLLLPETDHLGGRLLVQKIFRAIGKDRRLQELDKNNPLLLTIGTASYPRDGEDFDALLARCRLRLEDFRQSMWRKQHLSDLAFWELVGLFVGDEQHYQKLDSTNPPKALSLTEDRRGRSRHLMLDPDTWSRIQVEAVDELARNPDVRGVLFAGIGQLDEAHPLIASAPRASQAAAPIYVLGAAPRAGFVRVEATNVTAVPVDDPLVALHHFLLLLTEVGSYAFVGRRSKNGSVYGYHTADSVLVESLVARLQDQYYLQGRF